MESAVGHRIGAFPWLSYIVTVLGKCRLCLQTDDLQRSHVLPRWAYKRALDKGLPNPHPVIVSEGKAVKSSKQISDYLLCRDCEHRFKLREDTAAAVTYQKDGSARFLDLVGNVVQEGGGLRIAHPGQLDTAALAYFGASIVWRGSICAEVNDCALGPENEELLRKYLLEEEPFPENISCAMTFLDLLPPSGIQIGSFFGTPRTFPRGSSTIATLYIYGLHYHFTCGDEAQIRRQNCAVHSPEHWVALGPQEWLTEWFGDETRYATAVGSLAKDGSSRGSLTSWRK